MFVAAVKKGRLSILNSDMGRFWVKLVLFALLLGVVCTGLGTLMYFVEKEAYLDCLRLGPNDRLVAMGDSRSVQNLNPDYLPKLKNLSLLGAQIAVWEMRMRDLIEVNKGDGVERSFILEVSPLQFEVSRARHVKDWERDRAFFWLMHPELDKDAQFDSVLKHFMRSEFPASFWAWVMSVVKYRSFTSVCKGGFAAPSEKTGLTVEELLKKVTETDRRLASFRLSQDDIRWLERLRLVASAQNWNLILVTFPICGQSPTNGPMKSFVFDVSAWCRKRGVSYVDFSMFCRDEALWLDSVHLNRTGAQEIWEASRVNSVLNEKRLKLLGESGTEDVL